MGNGRLVMILPTIAKKCKRIVLLIFVLIFIFVCGWNFIYPSFIDLKNIKYILWKNGLCRMDIDTATAAMIGDTARDELIIGKTKAQIQNKFGILMPPAEAAPYYKNYYENSPWKSMEALYIDHSPWMIIFEKGKASNLILVKGW
jgi:hypothetical protein